MSTPPLDSSREDEQPEKSQPSRGVLLSVEEILGLVQHDNHSLDDGYHPSVTTAPSSSEDDSGEKVPDPPAPQTRAQTWHDTSKSPLSPYRSHRLENSTPDPRKEPRRRSFQAHDEYGNGPPPPTQQRAHTWHSLRPGKSSPLPRYPRVQDLLIDDDHHHSTEMLLPGDARMLRMGQLPLLSPTTQQTPAPPRLLVDSPFVPVEASRASASRDASFSPPQSQDPSSANNRSGKKKPSSRFEIFEETTGINL